MKQLLAFRGFAHDPQGVLTAVHQFALVGIERGEDRSQPIAFELGIAVLADTDKGRGALHDPQLAFLHDCSLAHPTGRA